MSLTQADKEWIVGAIKATVPDITRAVIFETVPLMIAQAIEELVFPRFEAIEQRLSKVEEDVRQMRLSLSFIEQRVDTIDGRLEAVEADVKELYLMLPALA